MSNEADTPKLKLYNTLTRTKEVFEPLDAANVRMYVCGPTVYDYAHIGNARPMIVFDVLFRLLRHIYGEKHVTYARNITDVDDKINARAVRDFPGLPLNEAIREVTEKTANRFQADATALGCLAPTHQPRATDHIDSMVAITQRLLDNDFAYIAKGTEGREVLFSVAKMPGYGKLSNRKIDEQRDGARVAVEVHKRNPGDFVLWKESGQLEPGWNGNFVFTTEPNEGYPAEFCVSPAVMRQLGANSPTITIYGRPGWHIECSAMSMTTLLEPFGGGLKCDDPLKNTFDIHGGGIDLVFPHHENEIAQSCCAFGIEKMASIWMHNGFLQIEGRKMSKSDDNFITIDDLLNTTKFGGRSWPGEVLRLAMLKTHYRQPIDWTVRALEEAEVTLKAWHAYEGLASLSGSAEVDGALLHQLSDDLNAAEVISRLHGLRKIGSMSSLATALDFLGLLNDAEFGPDRKTFHPEVDSTPSNLAAIENWIDARLEARRAKNFAESDRIRDELAAMGIALKDGKDADGNPTTTWEVKR